MASALELLILAKLGQNAAQADASPHTVTGASLTALSSAYTIPANDAQANTVYRLTAWGNAAWGSTQQALTIGGGLNGAVVTGGGGSGVIAATTFAASAALRWQATYTLLVAAEGTAGTCLPAVDFRISTLNASTSASMELSASSAQAFDTAAANTVDVLAAWAATTGAPAITCLGTVFERLGP